MTAATKQILLVTGMYGAGKSTVLRTLEDLGWEVVDNLPLLLLDRLLATALPNDGDHERPLALGFGAGTRGFDAEAIVRRIHNLREGHGHDVGLLFLECGDDELERRYAETRRRHPFASDAPAAVAMTRERALLAPLRNWANRLIDTTSLSAQELSQQIRAGFSGDGLGEPTLTVTSFGFARGLPRGADIVLDMRYLRNPHWVPDLKPGTGRDADVSAYIADDPAYPESMAQVEALLLTLLPRYRAEGKAYVNVAFGCTGGRHRSVHVAERIAKRLHEAGFSPTVTHRDLAAAPQDTLEGSSAASMAHNGFSRT